MEKYQGLVLLNGELIGIEGEIGKGTSLATDTTHDQIDTFMTLIMAHRAAKELGIPMGELFVYDDYVGTVQPIMPTKQSRFTILSYTHFFLVYHQGTKRIEMERFIDDIGESIVVDNESIEPFPIVLAESVVCSSD